ncbi:MAG: hypothetical protein EOP83_09945 [Verrucomicrobiaceae bacterium]|nr:MAG: hypothetical protein EOP83_09945 [Verrucomicrobiaceae bacterium]
MQDQDPNDRPRLVPQAVIRKHNLTPKQTRMVGLVTLWIILAGLWKTGETVVVILRWMFG